MSAALEVPKEERSREDRDEQQPNIPDMPVACEVSNEERSREDRDRQP